MSKYRVAITKVFTVEFDDSKLDDEFWDEFNSTIVNRGGPDPEYLAEHAIWNFVQGDEEFVEGIGPLDEMGVVIQELYDQSDIDVDAA